jgi:hypothetical protein
MRTTLATALCLGLALSAAPAMADLPEDAEALAGLYGGSYVCADGEHGVILNLTGLTARSDDRGYEVQGELSFFPVVGGADGAFADVAGSFELHGALYPNGRLILRAGDWIVEAGAYGAAGLNGTLSQREDGLWQITGIPADGAGACTDFVATRVAP